MEPNRDKYTGIIRFAEGRMTYDEFEILTCTNSDIWFLLQSMVNSEMKDDPNHPIWSDKGLRMRLEANGFSVRSAVEAFGLDTDFGKMILHSIIGNLVKYYFPDVKVRKPKDQSDTDLLEHLKLDCIAGCEVDTFIEDIIMNIPSDMTKKERKAMIKNALKEAFHIEGNKRPMWVQEPEWPMGQKSPMAYVSKKVDGELVIFTFRDVDTGEERVVEQAY